MANVLIKLHYELYDAREVLGVMVWEGGTGAKWVRYGDSEHIDAVLDWYISIAEEDDWVDPKVWEPGVYRLEGGVAHPTWERS
jgi:hypothetical protein